jgi:hypothetical protein
MAKLPRYQRLGVKSELPPDFDYANLRESRRFAQTVSQQVDRMNQFFAKEAELQARQSGLAAVEEQGARTILKQFTGEKRPSTIAQQTAFEAANRIASAEIEVEARAEINKIISDASINKTPLVDYPMPDGSMAPGVRTKIQDVVDGFPAGLADLDPVTAGVLRARLGSVAQDKELSYSEEYEKYKIQQVKGRFATSLAQFEQDLFAYAASENGTADGLEVRINDIANNMRDLQISEADISKWTIGARTKARKEGTIAEFQRLPTLKDKQDFLDQLTKKPPAELGVEDTRTLVRSLRTELSKGLTQLKTAGTTLEKQLRDDIKVIKEGGTVPQDRLNNYSLQITNAQGDDQQYFVGAITEYNNLITSIKVMDSVKRMTPTALTDYINEISQGMKGEGGKGRDTEKEQLTYDIATDYLQTMDTEMNRDPYSFAVRNGLVPFERIVDDKGTDEFKASLQARANQAKLVSTHYGVDVKIFTDAEATRFVNILKGDGELSNPDGTTRPITVIDQIATVTAMVSALGEDTSSALEQIAPKSPELAHIGGLALYSRSETATMAFKGMALKRDGMVAIGLNSLEAKELFKSTVGPALVASDQVYAAAKRTTDAIYNHLAKNETQFNADIYKEAVKLALCKGADGGGVEKVNNVPTFLFPGLIDDDLELMMEEIKVEQIKDLSGQDIDKKLLKDINDNNFVLMPAPEHLEPEKGDYIFYKEGSGGKTFVADSTGAPIIVNALKWKTKYSRPASIGAMLKKAQSNKDQRIKVNKQ